MAKSLSLLLSDHFDVFIDQLVLSGRYDSRSAAIRAGIRLLELEEKHLAWIREQVAVSEPVSKGASVHKDVDEQ